jgi:hypothetical protein
MQNHRADHLSWTLIGGNLYWKEPAVSHHGCGPQVLAVSPRDCRQDLVLKALSLSSCAFALRYAGACRTFRYRRLRIPIRSRRSLNIRQIWSENNTDAAKSVCRVSSRRQSCRAFYCEQQKSRARGNRAPAEVTTRPTSSSINQLKSELDNARLVGA